MHVAFYVSGQKFLKLFDICYLYVSFFIVSKVLSLSDAVTSGVYSDISERIKVYDRLGDMCAHGDYQFYEAAVKFYQMEV